jgi:hypothetical protein
MNNKRKKEKERVQWVKSYTEMLLPLKYKNKNKGNFSR